MCETRPHPLDTTHTHTPHTRERTESDGFVPKGVPLMFNYRTSSGGAQRLHQLGTHVFVARSWRKVNRSIARFAGAALLVSAGLSVTSSSAGANTSGRGGGGCYTSISNQRTTSGSTATTALGTCSTVGVDAVPYSDFFAATFTINDFDYAQGSSSYHGLGQTSFEFFTLTY